VFAAIATGYLSDRKYDLFGWVLVFVALIFMVVFEILSYKMIANIKKLESERDFYFNMLQTRRNAAEEKHRHQCQRIEDNIRSAVDIYTDPKRILETQMEGLLSSIKDHLNIRKNDNDFVARILYKFDDDDPGVGDFRKWKLINIGARGVTSIRMLTGDGSPLKYLLEVSGEDYHFSTKRDLHNKGYYYHSRENQLRGEIFSYKIKTNLGREKVRAVLEMTSQKKSLPLDEESNLEQIIRFYLPEFSVELANLYMQHRATTSRAAGIP
jgi:hypothetical protein